jgi:glutamate--cysteine ligase
MSNPGDADATPITSVRQLADHIAAGCKPAGQFRIGTEHEKFGFRVADLAPPPYEAADGGSVRAMLESLRDRHGAAAILDDGRPIGLRMPMRTGEASSALEPAGQLELSGAPLATLHDTSDELAEHIAQVRAAAPPLGLGYAPLGFHPLARRDQMPWMPKGRYAIMRRYMPLVGSLGLDMMSRTCTVQVNLDFSSESDMVRKLRVALALQPLATALFANSPFTEGKPNGFLSYRAQIWTDTDNRRSGIPAVLLEPGFGFERYATWLLDAVPMYFIYRNGRYLDLAGASFRAFMRGEVPQAAGHTATIGDFADHMTTVFTDVRLKRFLEMRGADAGSPAMMLAQSALWVGLLYDDAALAAAESVVRRLTWHELVALRTQVPRHGLDAAFTAGGRPAVLRDWLRDVVGIARDGLRSRAQHDSQGADETIYLQPLEAIAAGGPTQAERWIERYHKVWLGDTNHLMHETGL